MTSYTRFNDVSSLDENFFSSSFMDRELVTLNKKNEQNPRPSNKSLDISDYLVAFSTRRQNYCVGVVDMVNSTKICSSLESHKIPRYYEIFLNSMSKILGRFGGFVIKNVGDCLFFYFPESGNSKQKFGFLSCLEGCLALSELRPHLCMQLTKEGLPPLDYRISADYGTVAIMNTNNSSSIDMIGPPVNMCCKINHHAEKNGVVIGGDLYQMVKKFNDYTFKETKSYSIGMRYSYPVYSLIRSRM